MYDERELVDACRRARKKLEADVCSPEPFGPSGDGLGENFVASPVAPVTALRMSFFEVKRANLLGSPTMMTHA